jgi:uncharacterized protein YdeI (YjbR/CyaY-like superfamily)
VKPVLKKPQEISVPAALQESLNASPQLSSAFDKLTPGRQREYVQYIAEAKLEATRAARLEKILPLIVQGCGLNDKYRKC